MMKEIYKNTLPKSEVEKISLWYIKNIDKWHRMREGIGSKLERYENGIIYLRVETTEKKLESDYKMALVLIKSWVGSIEELSQAKGFVVSFYKTISTGFSIEGNDLKNLDLISNLQEELKLACKEDERELISIFSGLYYDGISDQCPPENFKLRSFTATLPGVPQVTEISKELSEFLDKT